MEAAENFRKANELKRMIRNLEKVHDKDYRVSTVKKAGKFELK